MNRTDRLYALVEELRRVSPRPRSAAWLARQFEVSVRTIERDLDSLRESGVPLWAEPGRTGGYGLDRDRTLPPLAFSPEEALAVTVALRTIDGSPFGEAAAGAARKVLAGLPRDVRDAEERLAARLLQVGPASKPSVHGGVLIAAVANRRVLRIRYVDVRGTATERHVEPLSLLKGPAGWYLVAWCRLRRAVRGFLLDRVSDVMVSDETAAPRDVDLDAEIDRIAARPIRE
jgi:predicted DNA-binding transcriptional regulator YafY